MLIKKKSIGEAIYIIAIIIYIIVLMLQSSMYVFNNSIYQMIEYAKKIGIILLIEKIFIDIVEQKNKFSVKRIFITFTMTVIFFLSMIKTDDMITTLYLLAILLASSNIKFEKTIKGIFYVELICFIVIIIGCQLGIISDYTIRRETGASYRHSLGFIHPNGLMLSFFSIVVIYMYLQKDKINLIKTIILLALTGVVFYYTDSRMGAIATTVAILVNYICKYKGNQILKRCKKIIPHLISIFAILSILVTVLYPKVDLSKLNAISSNRILLQYQAWENYGITLFGKKIEWVGQGASNEELNWKYYNFVDNSYIKALINNGILYFLIIMFGHYFILKKLIKDNNIYGCISVIMIGIYSISDVSLLRVIYNPFIILMAPMFSIYSSTKITNMKTEKEGINEKERIEKLYI